jgi:hypothetical protein
MKENADCYLLFILSSFEHFLVKYICAILLDSVFHWFFAGKICFWGQMKYSCITARENDGE